MRIQRTILTLLGLFALLGLLAPARGAYFPDPTPTADWDMIYGDIITGSYGPSSEVAAWDASGVLRFRANILTDAFGPYFEMSEFYGPPTGSDNPYDFTWQIYDGSTLWSATIDDTNWLAWEGDRDPFWVNLDRDQPLRVVPEPATLLVLSLLGGSGIVAGLKKKRKLKQ